MNADSQAESYAGFWQQRWQSGSTPWDHGEAAPPLLEFIDRKGAPGGHVLVPGCGSGHDVRLLATHGAEVTGLDISPLALEMARRTNGHPSARFLLGDILAPAAEFRTAFDWVVEHTCLCALPPAHWVAYVEGVRAVLRPGGSFLGIFYRRPHDSEGPPFGIAAEDIDRLFSAGFQLVEAWIPGRAYPSRVGREELRLYRRIPSANGQS